MGKNQSASNLPNIIKQDANGSIAFMHGNTMLMQVSSSGAITTTGVISGSNALSASYAVSASAAASAVTAVTAQTASFANAFTVAGNLTAQTLVVQTITSSVDFVTGSTRFGSLAANTHTFTGSVLMSGSVGIGISSPTELLEVSTILPRIKITSTTNTNNAGLYFSTKNSSGTTQSGGIYYTPGSTPYVSLSGDNNNSHLSVTSAGNVGIGVTNPTFPLTRNGMTLKASGTDGVELVMLSNTDTGFLGGALVRSGADFGFINRTNGSLIFATNATERMWVNNAGNVGINESSPSSLLHFSKQTTWGTSDNRIININNSGTGGNINVAHNMGSITWYSGNSTPTAEIAAYRNTPASGNNIELRFYTATVGNPIESMRISSAGTITRPFQPAFLAYSENSGFTVTGGGWYNISNALTVESYDIGSNYSGGRFTAPVAGRYFFYAGGWSNIGSAANGERYAWSAVVNNGSQTFLTGGNYSIGDTPLSGYSIVYNLNAGDYVDLFVFSAVTGTWGAGTHRVFFGGYLL